MRSLEQRLRLGFAAKTLSAGLLLIAAMPAQVGDILLVERSADRAGRNILAREFRRTVMDLNAEEMTVKEFATFLGIATSNRVNFLVSAREMDVADLPTITMSVRKLNLLAMMGIISRQTDLRFVYVSGVVMIKPKDDVREQRSLVIYDIRAAVAPLRDFPGPSLELRRGDDYEPVEELDSDKTISGFDIDSIQDLIRTHVAAESWEEDGNSMSASSGSLIVRQTARNHAALREFLVKLGVIPAPALLKKPLSKPPAVKPPAVKQVVKKQPAVKRR